MVKLLVLQFLYNLSDEQVIQDASLNLAYMYFLNINPDEGLPQPINLIIHQSNFLISVSHSNSTNIHLLGISLLILIKLRNIVKRNLYDIIGIISLFNSTKRAKF